MWIPLLEYALRKGVSLSTLRRYIKANRIPYRIEDGRYLLLCEDVSSDDDYARTQLEQDLQKAREEIAELKTLVALYEETINPNDRTVY